jgi:hypothetical protein
MTNRFAPLFISAVTGAIITVSPVSAQTIIGAGVISCGEWLRVRSFESGPKNTKEVSSSYQLQAWIHGYLSGIDLANVSGIDFLGRDIASRPSQAASNAWVDNYCRSKPLDLIVDAVDALITELRSRADKR